ncbi:Receptor-like kinase [Quillaja saponaria]|uniref:Receptor-like serine/threonine-protein kinase n=1 Tax=Quillaja saponaria TaxID=32244 RepID=A0AAD7PGV4_QUISA|nr:Receptor-like kinase [Quillaja saponaria]
MALFFLFNFFLTFFFFFLLSYPPPSLAQQQNPLNNSSFTISDSPWHPNQNRTLLSPNSIFAAGFLVLPNSPNLFTFSIWYHNLPGKPVVVWSANPISPVNSSASLAINSKGELLLLNDTSGRNLWPSQNASVNSNSSQLVLSNNGSLIFGNWKSFDFPTDTILTNQIFPDIDLNSKDGKFRFKNSSFLVLVSSSARYYTAPNPFLMLNDVGRMVTTKADSSFFTADNGEIRLRRLVLDEDGNLRIYSFDSETNQWVVVWQAVQELCQIKGTCGPNAICMPTNTNGGFDISTYCVCPSGFKPINPDGPKQGCTWKIKPLNKAKFLQLDYVNFSSGGNLTKLIAVKNFSDCESHCLADTNCLGFGVKYNGSGYCSLQFGRLIYGYWSPGTETSMFVRVDESENEKSNFTGLTNLLETTCSVGISLPLPPKESNTTTRNIVIVSTLFAAELISGILFFWSFLKKYIKYRDMAQTLGLELLPAGGPKRFTYSELKTATNDFSNLIGRGGFGDVYKGELTDHRVVAVKCLRNLISAEAEFWAEVTIIARMHHLNLVRLWGFCLEKGQRILVYEYVPNGSLDKYLFRSGRVEGQDNGIGMGQDADLKPVFDWNVRYRIALGVARAIAYLHEECLEWVLHCDIKPENILLGDDFCPKISDFGLAKLRKKEDVVSMSQMRGTRGYMAPEWVKADTITSKADVYSFGMVLLELVSGVRNFEIQGSLMVSEDWYFPKWAFDKVFIEMKVEDILDRQIKHTYDCRAHFDMVDRMVKTAMWCLQSRPEMRPTMGKVAKMLEGTLEITEPLKPTIFYLGDE